jgi:hypothetical protein
VRSYFFVLFFGFLTRGEGPLNFGFIFSRAYHQIMNPKMEDMKLKWIVLALLPLTLGSCIYVTDRNPSTVSASVQNNNYITSFAPTEGEGRTYFVGDKVRFRLATTRAGYVTLVSYDPDGYSNVIADNVRVGAGTSYFPEDLPGRPKEYTLVPPRGLQRVKAIFTSDLQSSRGKVTIEGRYDSRTGWDNQITLYVNGYDARVRDVRETFFYIR